MADTRSERPLSVCITFDYDALSLWVGMLASTSPTEVSRGEFATVAIGRILTYLREQEIPATFAVPGHTLLAYPDTAKAIAADGHEFAHHGWVHELVSMTDEAGEREVLDRGFDAFDKVLGVRPALAIGHRGSTSVPAPSPSCRSTDSPMTPVLWATTSTPTTCVKATKLRLQRPTNSVGRSTSLSCWPPGC